LFFLLKFTIFDLNKNIIKMNIEEKIELNKLIRKYTGSNSFVLSIQKYLKNSKNLSKELYGKRMVKVLSEPQYESVKSAL